MLWPSAVSCSWLVIVTSGVRSGVSQNGPSLLDEGFEGRDGVPNFVFFCSLGKTPVLMR